MTIDLKAVKKSYELQGFAIISDFLNCEDLAALRQVGDDYLTCHGILQVMTPSTI